MKNKELLREFIRFSLQKRKIHEFGGVKSFLKQMLMHHIFNGLESDSKEDYVGFAHKWMEIIENKTGKSFSRKEQNSIVEFVKNHQMKIVRMSKGDTHEAAKILSDLLVRKFLNQK